MGKPIRLMPFEIEATGEVAYLPTVMCGRSQAWGKVVGPEIVHDSDAPAPQYGVQPHKPARNATRRPAEVR